MPSAIHRLVPLNNENRWSDLLAVFIENDASTAAAVLGLGEVMGRNVSVARDVPAAGGADRVDILVHVDGLLEAVLEAKVLSGLGVRQLDRYSASYPDARNISSSLPAGSSSILVLHSDGERSAGSRC